MGEVASGEVEPLDGVWDGEALVDRYCVCDAVPRVEDDARRAARCVEGEHGLDLDVERRNTKCFEHDLDHLFPVDL